MELCVFFFPHENGIYYVRKQKEQRDKFAVLLMCVCVCSERNPQDKWFITFSCQFKSMLALLSGECLKKTVNKEAIRLFSLWKYISPAAAFRFFIKALSQNDSLTAACENLPDLWWLHKMLSRHVADTVLCDTFANRFMKCRRFKNNHVTRPACASVSYLYGVSPLFCHFTGYWENSPLIITVGTAVLYVK